MAKQDKDRLAGYTVVDGQFGNARPEIKLAFPYFGETIRVHPQASDIGWTKFLDSISHLDAEQVGDLEALNATMDYVRQQIHPDDWELFWETATANAQNSIDLVELAKDIVSTVAGFPTGQPVGSTPGRQPTDHLSKGGSRRPGRGGRSKQERKEAAQRRVIAAASASGRADLALTALEAYEHTTGRHLHIVDGQVVGEISDELASQTA